MKKLTQMSYKGIKFLSNPSLISLTMKSNTASQGVVGKGEMVENINSTSPIVRGKGTFIGDNAIPLAKRLSALIDDKSSGLLFAPGINPMMAYFISFSYEINSTKNAVTYSFSFVGCDDERKSTVDIKSTTAQSGENAFDIAKRMNVSVDDIMENNCFKTPFDINENDEVMIK